jgi:hypothetical protein
MGLIIFPFLLAVAGTCIIAIAFIIRAAIKKEIRFGEVCLGLLATLLIYGLVYADYELSTSAYALGAYFMFPFYMVLLPFFTGGLTFIIGATIQSGKKDILRRAANTLFMCAIFSGLFLILFKEYTFGIIDYLGLQKTY